MAPPDKKPKYLDEKLNESLQLAIQDVQNGLSLRKAAKNHGIHHQTLSYKIKKMDSCFVKPGVSQTLTEECNAGLKDWILDRSEMGLPATKHDLLKKAGELSTYFPNSNGKSFKDVTPTHGFAQAFMKRNPDLVCKKTQATTPDRAKVQKIDILEWHGDVKQRLDEEGKGDQLKCPENMFNLDEIGFNTDAKDVKGIFLKGAKRNHTIAFGAPHGHLTMICCVSAAGEAQTPLFLLKGKQRLNDAIKAYEADGFAARASASGYTTTADMAYYLEHVFIPDQARKGRSGPFTIFLDNASSHSVLEILWLARKLNITLITLYPNSTDVTQPLDLTVFKQMKDVVCSTIRNEFQDTVVSAKSFTKVMKIVYSQMFPNDEDGKFVPNKLVMKGFKDTGLFPFDSANVQFDLLFAQEPTRLIESAQNVILKKSSTRKQDIEFVDVGENLQDLPEDHLVEPDSSLEDENEIDLVSEPPDLFAVTPAGQFSQTTFEEHKYSKQEVFGIINDILGLETTKKLKTHQYRVDCESTNQVSKIWHHFQPIIEPTDLLYIQPRVTRKTSSRRAKAVCGVVTSDALYKKKSVKIIMKKLQEFQNDHKKGSKLKFKEQTKLQAARNRELKKLITAEKKQLPAKNRKNAVIPFSPQMVELQEKMEEFQYRLDLAQQHPLRELPQTEEQLNNATDNQRLKWQPILTSFEETMEYSPLKDSGIVLFDVCPITLEQQALIVHKIYEDMEISIRDRDKYCHVIVECILPEVVLEICQRYWEENRDDSIYYFEIMNLQLMTTKKTRKTTETAPDLLENDDDDAGIEAIDAELQDEYGEFEEEDISFADICDFD